MREENMIRSVEQAEFNQKQFNRRKLQPAPTFFSVGRLVGLVLAIILIVKKSSQPTVCLRHSDRELSEVWGLLPKR